MLLFYGLFGLMAPLVGLVLVATAIHVIWRTITLPRRTKLAAVCERCKYDVANLASFTCPECGEDLRRVGIVTPAMEARRRGSLAGAIIGWTFLCGLVAYIGVTATFMWTVSTQMTRTFSDWEQMLTPNSGSYRSIVVAYQSDGMSIGSEIELVITMPDGATHPLTIDPGPMKVYGVSNVVTDWSPGTVESWFRQIGLNTTDPAVAAEAAEVSNFVDLLIMSPSSGFSPNMVRHQIQLTTAGSVSAMPDPVSDYLLVFLSTLAALALVYILGLIFIVRRRRKLLRSVGAL